VLREHSDANPVLALQPLEDVGERVGRLDSPGAQDLVTDDRLVELLDGGQRLLESRSDVVVRAVQALVIEVGGNAPLLDG